MAVLLLAESTVNYSVVAFVTVLYVLVTGYLGFLGYKGTKTATDYLLAGRKTHPFVMAMSYGATFISTSAIVGFGGVAALMGMGVLWLTVLNIFVGIFIAFVFIGKRTRRIGHNMDAHTFPELLGRCFQSRFIQVFAAALIFLFMPLYGAAVLRGGAEFIGVIFDVGPVVATLILALIIAAYVLAGGMKGVMLTDALQASIMFLGMLILLVMTYWKLGGVIDAHQALTDLADRVPAKLQAAGHRGWTSMPEMGKPLWYSMVTTIVMGVGIGVLAQPQLAVRFMMVKSGRELNRAVAVGGVFILMMTGVAFTVGALSNVYFVQEGGMLAVASVEGGNIDKIFPTYISHAMPSWFVTIFMLSMLSAAMSTLSSQFHTMGTAFGRDIVEQGLQLSQGRTRSVLITRVGIIIAFSITLWLGLKMEIGIIAAATAIFFGLCASAFLPVLLGALYTRRINKPGAISGMVAGALVSMFWLTMVHTQNADRVGLLRWISGNPDFRSLLPAPWSLIDPLIIALPISLVVTIAVSLLTKPMDRNHVENCMDGF